jgi:hypothetical protein
MSIRVSPHLIDISYSISKELSTVILKRSLSIPTKESAPSRG